MMTNPSTGPKNQQHFAPAKSRGERECFCPQLLRFWFQNPRVNRGCIFSRDTASTADPRSRGQTHAVLTAAPGVCKFLLVCVHAPVVSSTTPTPTPTPTPSCCWWTVILSPFSLVKLATLMTPSLPKHRSPLHGIFSLFRA